jgi:hypothetical protein
MQPTTFLGTAPYLFEFHPAVRNDILSRIQVDILVHRAEDVTYRKLCSDYRMCNQEAFGFHWSRACQGGPLSFLSDLDIRKFEESAIEHGRQFNCLNK